LVLTRDCRIASPPPEGINQEDFQMRKLLLAAVALGSLIGLTASGAMAAPLGAGVHVAPAQPAVTDVQYYYNHRHWHHRHYEHGHYHYY
jgi:hypothetical protein